MSDNNEDTQIFDIDSEVLGVMRRRGGLWYVYQNVAFDSYNLGHLQFLQCGAGCTYDKPPEYMPDTQHGLGWRYRLASPNPVVGEST